MVKAVVSLAFLVAAAEGFVPSQHSSPVWTKLAQSSNAATDIEATTATSTAESSASREKILKEPALWEYNFGLQDPGLTLPHGILKDVSLPEKYEITEEQIRTLEEDGVVHIKGVFDEEWVDYLRKATQSL